MHHDLVSFVCVILVFKFTVKDSSFTLPAGNFNGLKQSNMGINKVD